MIWPSQVCILNDSRRGKMSYRIRNFYDPFPGDTDEDKARVQQMLRAEQQAMRKALPRLRDEIENEERDPDSVYNAVRPYYQAGHYLPMTVDDLPLLERFCRRILEVGGPRQAQIQEILLRMIGATAVPQSVPFLQEMWQYSRRGDQFGPERRQLALWGLARIAARHNQPQAYATLRQGLDDHHADVRYTAADLILDAYLTAQRDVPQDVVQKLRHMAESDPDRQVRWAARRYLKEPWAQENEE